MQELSDREGQFDLIGVALFCLNRLRPFQLRMRGINLIPNTHPLGLRTALVAMIEKVSASSTIQFTHAVDELDGLFRPGDEITLYRIVQECLNNILKHSGATTVALNLAVQADELALTIRDNGRGFRPDEETHRRAGLGLQGIAERVRILGGTHAIESAPGQGTTVTLKIALKDKQR
jgi:two-component system, sensor histidine kinase LadS